MFSFTESFQKILKLGKFKRKVTEKVAHAINQSVSGCPTQWNLAVRENAGDLIKSRCVFFCGLSHISVFSFLMPLIIFCLFVLLTCQPQAKVDSFSCEQFRPLVFCSKTPSFGPSLCLLAFSLGHLHAFIKYSVIYPSSVLYI